MQKDNKFFDDIAKAASGAASGMLGMKREIEDLVSAQLEKLLGKMNLSTKEEVDTALGMLTKIREEQEKIKNRLDVLEKRDA
jgi:BMFP domain-containing protein YqiC